MSESPSEFFKDRGFALTFSTHTRDELAAIYAEAGISRKKLSRALSRGAIGPVFANLHAANGQVLRGYGTGADEASAANRAMERWKQEQGG